MAEELNGNCLIAQSGGPTAVINSSLAGAISEALNHPCIEEIYGARNGVIGILQEDLIDLAEESQQVIRGLRTTPASALGTCRYKLRKQEDFERILQVFETHNIRYFFYIGGNDSQDSADRIAALATERGYDLRVIGIPKTVDNDLVATDHCPGYGSAVKYLCTTVQEMACDARSMGNHDYVGILEVMGRNAGWLAAGTSLVKRKDRPDDPPHIILLPEVPLSQQKLMEDIQRILQKERYCLIVASEGLVDEDGNYLTTSGGSTDAFGHAQLGGVGEYLRNLIEEQFGLRSRAAKLGHAQRAGAHCASEADNEEAFLAGRAAVEAAVGGESGKMVTLLRAEKETYECVTGLAPLSEVANGVKKLPEDWINENGVSMNHQFIKYAQPLIQGESSPDYEEGLPSFVRIRGRRVERNLEPYEVE
ncbi:MAG: 6-phosphofructokinase [Verrucomicrobiota bacterium]